jgi:hypothetical protein
MKISLLFFRSNSQKQEIIYKFYFLSGAAAGLSMARFARSVPGLPLRGTIPIPAAPAFDRTVPVIPA